MLYNVVLVSAAQQHKSVIIIYICPLPLEPSSPPPSTPLYVITECQAGLPVLYTASYQLFILHTRAYICKCYSLSLSRPLLPWLSTQVRSLCLHLYACPANRLISVIFLDFHMYTLIYDICFSLSDLLHSV